MSVKVPAIRLSHRLAPDPCRPSIGTSCASQMFLVYPQMCCQLEAALASPSPLWGGAGLWGPLREGTHFCGLQNLFLVLQNR